MFGYESRLSGFGISATYTLGNLTVDNIYADSILFSCAMRFSSEKLLEKYIYFETASLYSTRL